MRDPGVGGSTVRATISAAAKVDGLLSGSPSLQLLRVMPPTFCPGFTPEPNIPGIVVSRFALLVICVQALPFCKGTHHLSGDLYSKGNSF